MKFSSFDILEEKDLVKKMHDTKEYQLYVL